MFLHLSFSHSVHRGRYPPGQVTPWAGTPLGRYTPLEGTPPGQVPPWAGTPPGQVHPLGRYTPMQVPPGAGTPHPAMHAWIRSTSGRYASYWNAFLFLM